MLDNLPPGVTLSMIPGNRVSRGSGCPNCESEIWDENETVELQLFQKVDITGLSAKHGWKNCHPNPATPSSLETKTITVCEHCRPELLADSARVLIDNGDLEDAADLIAESLGAKLVNEREYESLKDTKLACARLLDLVAEQRRTIAELNRKLAGVDATAEAYIADAEPAFERVNEGVI